MTVIKKYLEMPTLEAEACISDVIHSADCTIVRLDETIFHPQGGGQKPDRGLIAGVPVLDVRHAESGEVDHFVRAFSQSVGETVALTVDAAWRYECSRWHSGGHLIADLGETISPGLRAARGHHWPGEARVEFEGAVESTEQFQRLLKEALAVAVEVALPFEIVGDPYSNRTVKIGQNTPVPCGGTHVKTARELLGIEVTKTKHKRGVLRVSYVIN